MDLCKGWVNMSAICLTAVPHCSWSFCVRKWRQMKWRVKKNKVFSGLSEDKVHGRMIGGGGGKGSGDAAKMALVCLFWRGQATPSELTGRSETTASSSWNIALACPVCVRDQNKYKLHTNASKQLPCYSTKVVYNGNMVLLRWGGEVGWYHLIWGFVNQFRQGWQTGCLLPN